jgi:hypothetical protein
MEKRLDAEWLKTECRMAAGKDQSGAYVRIPYLDEHREAAATRKRYAKGSKKRFAWNKGDSPTLYGLWRLEQIRENGYVILVEGESDSQTLWTLGFPALGVPGAQNFKSEWTEKLKDLETVYLHIEPDTGGEGFYQQMLRRLSDGGYAGTVKTFNVGPLGVKDPSELWCRDGDEAKTKLQGLLETADRVDLNSQVIAYTVEGAPVALKQPDGWLFGEDGVWSIDADSGLKTNVCATPLIISKRMRSRDTGQERVEVSFKRDGSWQTVNISRQELFTSRGIVRLADNGVMVNSENAKYLVRYLDALEKNNMDIIEKVDCTEQTGWQPGNRFMPFFADGVVFDTQNQHIMEYLCKNGTREGWVDAMKKHREGWRFRFILAASFAAPLLSILKVRNFVVYVWGDSRGGKTAALKAALSVWGDPDKLMVTYNGTDNAIETHCAAFNDLPVGIDERQISGANEKNLGTLVYKLCEGTGRKRLNKDSSLKAAKLWRNVFLTTGEEPIISDRTMSGVSSRVLEIEGKPFESELDAAEMHRLCGENFGWAGPTYIENLRDEDNRRVVKEWFYGLGEHLTKGATAANISHVACVAAVGVADILASQIFFSTGFQEAMAQAAEMCQKVLGLVVDEQPQDVNQNAVQYLWDWITVHWQNFGKDPKGPVYGYFDAECIYLVPSTFNQIMEEGHYSARKTKRYLAEMGYLKFSFNATGKREFTVVRWDGSKSVRYVAILRSKLEDHEDGIELKELDGQASLPFYN